LDMSLPNHAACCKSSSGGEEP